MYIGRIVAIARTKDNRGAALYRVSSRSFPNRMAKTLANAVAIVPKPGFENDIQKNPYIAYDCLRLANGYAIVTNGSQTDPIAEKIASGMAPRDALAYVMLSMDYEHDSLDTPRISAIVTPDGSKGWLAIVRKDALLVREFALKPGEAYYVATYEKNRPADDQDVWMPVISSSARRAASSRTSRSPSPPSAPSPTPTAPSPPPRKTLHKA